MTNRAHNREEYDANGLPQTPYPNVGIVTNARMLVSGNKGKEPMLCIGNATKITNHYDAFQPLEADNTSNKTETSPRTLKFMPENRLNQ